MLFAVWVLEPFQGFYIVPNAKGAEDALRRVGYSVLLTGHGLVTFDDDIRAEVVQLDPEYWEMGFALDLKDNAIRCLFSKLKEALGRAD